MDSTIHMFYDEEETYDAILPGIKMKKKAKDLLGKITTNDIRKQVNTFDKLFGIHLKNPSAWAYPDKYKKRSYAQAEIELKALICVINGINPRDYLNLHSKASRKKISKYASGETRVFDKYQFTDYSNINWASGDTSEDFTMTFRKKFVTLVLQEFVGEIKSICKKYVRYKYPGKAMSSEKEIIAVKELMDTLVKFTFIMTHPGAEYKNVIMSTMLWLSFKRKGMNHKEYAKVLVDHIRYSRKYTIKETFTNKAFYGEDESIEAIINTAFVAVTEKTIDRYGYIPKHKYFKGATLEYNLIKLIEALGEAILASRKEFAPMYRAYKNSRPSIWSHFTEEAINNPAIREGIIALSYLKFVFDDREMDNFIEKMLRTGI